MKKIPAFSPFKIEIDRNKVRCSAQSFQSISSCLRMNEDTKFTFISEKFDTEGEKFDIGEHILHITSFTFQLS